ncbi:hypothetical protein [Pseudomonas asplenii]|uniref:hypothetical protein n=1 Tax=Pseudomonas asplenii TaxID=53407 RepID=UPI0003715985|nr:hypothetical protein [Pseudomonas fuscovaginae]
MTPQADSPPTRTRKLTSLITRSVTGLGVLLGALWALITYVVPDPSVFGFSFISWKNVVLLVSTFIYLGTLSIAWQIRHFPPLLFGTVQFCLLSGLPFGFFILGTEYAKPSFEFAKVQARIIENDGSNLLGKRMEVVDSVRFELEGCENIGRLPTCTFELTNLGVDRQFRFNGDTRLFDDAGGPLTFEAIRVGQVEGAAWQQIQLVRNVPTRVTLIFQQSSKKLSRTPAIRLLFNDDSGKVQTLKFSDIVMQ